MSLLLTGPEGCKLEDLLQRVYRRYLTARLLISLKCKQEKNVSEKLFKYEEISSNQSIIKLMTQ